MTFTIGDITGMAPVQSVAAPDPEPEVEVCEITGKVIYRNKKAAQRAVLAQRGDRSRLQKFRCGYCNYYHLGKNR